MNCAELSWLVRLWDDGERRRSDEFFNFALGAGTKILSFTELSPFDIVVWFCELVYKGVVGRGVGVMDFSNACIKTELDALAEGRVAFQEVVVPQGGCPGIVMIGRASWLLRSRAALSSMVQFLASRADVAKGMSVPEHPVGH